MEIYYINSNGVKLDFLSGKIAIQDIDTLFDNEWSYATATSMIFGGKVKKFYKACQEKEFTVSIFCDSEEEFTNLSKEIEDVLFYDTWMKTPGRLYVNDTYLSCFIYSSEYSDYEDLFFSADRKFKLVTEYPNWVAERGYLISRTFTGTTTTLGFCVVGLGVLNDSGTSSDESDIDSRIENPLSIPCNFRIKMHGASEWPYLKVGDNIYNVDVEIPEGGYLVVDSKERTCTLYDSDGNETNVFGYRNPDHYIFEKLPPGVSEVTWGDLTPVEFTVYEERGEPLWS